MQYRPRILYVEDDVHLSFVTRDNLEIKGYRVTWCREGHEALEAFENNNFDVCILDVMLPGIDGFTLSRKFREKDEQVPIIFLSAKSHKEDRIEGLTAGADDYMTKPYSIEELILKIEIFLKRSKIDKSKGRKRGVFEVGAYRFDFQNMKLSIGENTRNLTSRETELLYYLVRNQNNIVKKEEILREVWESDSYFNSRSLDVFISRLRKFLSKDPNVRINNIHGIGFMLAVDEGKNSHKA